MLQGGKPVAHGSWREHPEKLLAKVTTGWRRQLQYLRG
jgi:hypothetical protein